MDYALVRFVHYMYTKVIYFVLLPCFSCIVVEERNRVVLLGSNVSFTCVANITTNPPPGIEPVGILINNKHHLTSTDTHLIIEIYGNRGFTWTFFERGSQKIGKIYVLASEQNNGTTIRCIIVNEKITEEEKLIVVKGMLIME